MKVYSSSGIVKVTGEATGKTSEYYKQASTSPNECWYTAGSVGNGSVRTTGAPAIDVMHAMPIISRRAGVLDGFGINVTANAAGSHAKLLIYSNLSDSKMYPNALVAASTEFDTSTNGTKKDTSQSITLSANTLYWMVYWCGTLAPTIRCLALAQANESILGTDNTFGTAPSLGFQVAQAYSSGSNPSTYPGSATFFTAIPIPAMFYRYSS